MSDEAEFLRLLEATPGDETLRLVYADWLQDHGRRMKSARQRKLALGWKSLIRLARVPGRDVHCEDDGLPESQWGEWFSWGTQPSAGLSRLPQRWFTRVKRRNQLPDWEPFYWAYFRTHRAAMDAAALAFAELPEAVRGELLAVEVGDGR